MLEEVAGYVHFGAEDAARLGRLGPVLGPHFDAIVDDFYSAIEAHPDALAVFEDAAQIERQKGFLRRWLVELFAGTYDDDYYERRARIGRAHVRIGLEQRYMFAAMNVVRDGLHEALDLESSRGALGDATTSPFHRSLDRICDIELAIMLETYREDYATRIRSGERLATLGQFAASIGHELRNPLAVVETSLHLLRRRMGGDARAERHLGRIGQQVVLCNTIITDLLDLARDRAPERSRVDVADLVAEVTRDVVVPPDVTLRVDVPDGTIARVDRSQMRQLVMNLVLNAVQALEGRGTVTVKARSDARELRLTVGDDGPGLSREALDHLFEPLFTTRVKGIGLGLALCQRIAAKHGGSIEGRNADGGGAIFEVVVPENEEGWA